MLRLLGAALIFGGACWSGWQAGQQLLIKIRNLRDLIGALERMEQELAFRLTPLPELLSSLAEQTEGPVGVFFKQCGHRANINDGMFVTAWKREAERLKGQMDDRAIESLARLGYGIGRYDWEEERRLISFTISELKGYLREEMQESSRCNPLYRTLGAAAGALLVILLL